MKQLKIYYPDNTVRVINPQPSFDGKYKDLAISLSGGQKIRWKVS